jgi:PAS domain-containing protein
MSHHSGSKKTPTGEMIALRKQVADLKEAAIARRRVEEALRAAELLHRTTLEESPAGIVRLDASGRVLYANPAFMKLLGYESRQDFNTIGKLRGVFLNDAEARRMIAPATGSPTEMVIRCLRRDGGSEALRLLVGGAGLEEGVTLVHAGPGVIPQG